jgi:hypothetical protein
MAKYNKISLRAGKSAPMTGVGRAAIQANRSSQPRAAPLISQTSPAHF